MAWRQWSQASIGAGQSKRGFARAGKPGKASGRPTGRGIQRTTSGTPSIHGFRMLRCQPGRQSGNTLAGKCQGMISSMLGYQTGELTALRDTRKSLVSPEPPLPAGVQMYTGPMMNVRAAPPPPSPGIQAVQDLMITRRAPPPPPSVPGAQFLPGGIITRRAPPPQFAPAGPPIIRRAPCPPGCIPG